MHAGKAMPTRRTKLLNDQLGIVIKPNQALNFDADQQNHSTVVTLQQPTSSGNEVDQVPLPLFLYERFPERMLKEVIRNQCCTDSECFQFDVSNFLGYEEDPTILPRPLESVPSSEGIYASLKGCMQ